MMVATMHLNQQMATFSEAYARAVAAAAGFAVSTLNVDDDSIDMGFAARSQRIPSAPRLEVQLKCTARAPLSHEEDGFGFDLPIKNHRDLCQLTVVPRLLVVLLVPAEPDEWLAATDQHSILRHAAYWLSLRGQTQSLNQSTVRVRLPKSQRFDPASLTTLFAKVAAGELA